jgi:hypothetical protein
MSAAIFRVEGAEILDGAAVSPKTEYGALNQAAAKIAMILNALYNPCSLASTLRSRQLSWKRRDIDCIPETKKVFGSAETPSGLLAERRGETRFQKRQPFTPPHAHSNFEYTHKIRSRRKKTRRPRRVDDPSKY